MKTGIHGKRPKTKTARSARLPVRERILVAAGDLFHKQGIRGVGVEAIAEAAGTNKMTLYRHFDSKDELIAEWVRGMVAHKEEEWSDLTAKHADDPQGLLQDWSRRTAAKLKVLEERGSALGNALAELPDPEHPARRVIQEYKVREHKRVVRLCKAAGFVNPTLAANLFSMLLEGAHSCVQCVGMGRFGGDLVQLVDLMVENARQQQRSATYPTAL
ncbi:MAG TPA: TetR/AcrR family transcriptional regulator [Gemmatimonadaceae bacterium]|jgi:AcrR family transcriptional regulator|nr:TetR/AcrR family transcriptional regulator [Gemmatimonadaceae bacterium]